MCHMAQINAGPWLDIGPFRRVSVFICHATGGHCEDWDPYKGSNQVVLHREQNEMLFDGPPTVRVYRRFKLSVSPEVDEGPTWELPEEECRIAAEAFRYDKMGGEPVWIHWDSTPLGRNGKPMRLLFQMTTSLVKFDITRDGMAYVFLDESAGPEPQAYLLWQGV